MGTSAPLLTRSIGPSPECSTPARSSCRKAAGPFVGRWTPTINREGHLKVAVLLNGPESAGETPSEMTEAVAERWHLYYQSLAEAGIESFTVALLPSTSAVTVRLRRGERIVTDGPFAETKEQLGGLVVLEVPDVATAIEWACRMPCAEAGTLEIRPVMDAST